MSSIPRPSLESHEQGFDRSKLRFLGISLRTRDRVDFTQHRGLPIEPNASSPPRIPLPSRSYRVFLAATTAAWAATGEQKMARRSPLKITKAQRHRQHIESQLGQAVPKVITYRAYPDEYKV